MLFLRCRNSSWQSGRTALPTAVFSFLILTRAAEFKPLSPFIISSQIFMSCLSKMQLLMLVMCFPLSDVSRISLLNQLQVWGSFRKFLPIFYLFSLVLVSILIHSQKKCVQQTSLLRTLSCLTPSAAASEGERRTRPFCRHHLLVWQLDRSRGPGQWQPDTLQISCC